MKVHPSCFALFLLSTSASAYIPSTPGSHESSPQISNPLANTNNNNQKKVAPTPVLVSPVVNDLQTVASHGMLGSTDDLMKRLSLGSGYAVASHPEDEEEEEIPAPVAAVQKQQQQQVETMEDEPEEIKLEEDVVPMALQEQWVLEIMEEMKEIKKLEEEAANEKLVVAAKQEQIKPTKANAKVESPEPKLTIAEDEEEDTVTEVQMEQNEIKIQEEEEAQEADPLVMAMAELEQLEMALMEELNDIKKFKEEANGFGAKQEQITPTTTSANAKVETTEEAPEEPKLTIVEDEKEEEDVAELLLQLEAEAAKEEPIISGWDEAEDDDEEDEEAYEATPAVMEENEPPAPLIVQEQAEPAIQETLEEEEPPLPFSPYSRQQMIGFSAVDDFSAKFDEKLPRRLVSSYRLDADGRRVNTRPAFVARTAHPNAQASDQAPSAIGNGYLESSMEQVGGLAPAAMKPAAPRIGYLPQEYSCESWFDTKSKVTAAVYGGKKDKKTTAEEEEPSASSAVELDNTSTDLEEVQEMPRAATPPPPQPSANWFDTQSKVTDAMYGNRPQQQHEEEEPSLQEKNHNAVVEQSAYFSNRYSYDNWHDNPKSNNLFLRYGHIE